MKIRAYLKKKKNEIKKFKRAIDRKIFLLSKYIYIRKCILNFFFHLHLRENVLTYLCIYVYVYIKMIYMDLFFHIKICL